MPLWLQIVLALLALVFNAGVTVVGVTWFIANRLNEQEQRFSQGLSAHQLADQVEFAAIRAEIVESGDKIRREFGETSAALRAKIHEFETWSRDEFLRKKSFYEVTKEMGQDIKRLLRQVTSIEAAARGAAKFGNGE